MLKRFFYLSLLLITYSVLHSNIVINEVLYNPEGSDTGFEWIELFNNGDQSVNLFDWKIESAGAEFISDCILPNLSINAGNYFLIGEENVVGADFVDNLNFRNGGSDSDGIRLVSPDEQYTDTILYDAPNTNNLPDDVSIIGTQLVANVAEGKSIARKHNGIDTNMIDDWYENQFPSPGTANILPIDLQILIKNVSVVGNLCSFSTETTNLSTEAVDNSLMIVHIRVNDIEIITENYSEIQANGIILQEYEINISEDGIHYISIELEFENDFFTENNSDVKTFLIGESPLILNEIMFKPDNDKQEWIEIYNNSENDITINKYFIEDNAGGKIEFSSIINSHEFLVICSDSLLLSQTYPQSYPHGITTAIGWTTLNNTSERLWLKTTYETVLDSLNYEFTNWDKDISLERLDPLLTMSEWHYSISEFGATPTLENSVVNMSADLYLKAVKLISYNNESITIEATIENLSTICVDKLEAEISFEINNEFVKSENLQMIEGESEICLNFDLTNTISGLNLLSVKIILINDPNQDNNFSEINFLRGQSPIVINEIFFKPESNNCEWLEIFNRGNDIISLQEVKIFDASGGIIDFPLEIQPKSFLVICENKETILSNYTEINEFLVIEANSWTSLNNSDESLSLEISSQQIIDSLQYAGSEIEINYSLERINPYLEKENNFGESISEFGATPTYNNSLYPPEFDLDVNCEKIILTQNQIQHKLIITNLGISKLTEFSLLCKQIDSENSVFIFSDDYSLTDSIVCEFKTDFQSKGYFCFEYLIENEMDENLANNKEYSFLNNGYYPIVINEIMFNPKEDEPEWVEIFYNNEYEELSGVYFYCNDDSVYIENSGSKFIILTSSFGDATQLEANFSLYDIPIMTGLSSLSNSGACLKIVDDFGNVLDSLNYNVELSPTKGISLERINSLIEPSDANWGQCVNDQDCTIGIKNSIFVKNENSKLGLSVSPNPFSPYKNEHTIITLILPEPLNRITCRIFDLQGREVNKIMNQKYGSSEISMVWNGRNFSEKILPIGIYIVYVDATAEKNNKTYSKKTTIVIGK